MKIRNEQLRALQENENRQARPLKPGNDFSELLTRQLDKADADAQATCAPTSVSGQQILAPLTLATQTQSSASPFSEEAAGRMDGMFSTVERYAGQMAKGDGADLREAYSLLDELGGQIAEFKARFSALNEEMPEMAAMLNELDVLKVTETFKFNRGDYA